MGLHFWATCSCFLTNCVILSRFLLKLKSDLVKSDLDPTITIDEFDHVTVKSLIKYLYYDSININDIDSHLLLAAYQYKVKNLFMICERHLAETLHKRDIPKTLSAATKVNSKALLKVIYINIQIEKYVCQLWKFYQWQIS